MALGILHRQTVVALHQDRVQPPRAGGAGAVRHQLGAMDVERQTPAIGAVLPLRRPRRDPPAPELDRVACRVSGVSRRGGEGTRKPPADTPLGPPAHVALTGFETALKRRPYCRSRRAEQFQLGGQRPYLGLDHRDAERGQPALRRPDDGGLGFLDQELAVLDPIAERDVPPIHILFRREAANSSRMRSPITSRSNWAKEKRMLRVRIRELDPLVRPLIDLKPVEVYTPLSFAK
jgi:hypothetical protein